MISFLSRKMIGDAPSADDPKVRHAYGMLCSIVGIFLNIVLFAAKFIAGTLSGSIAISADAFNNLSDAGSSVITLLGFLLARQKPDTEHPMGHGRMEYIAGLFVAIAILLMGIELLRTAVSKILSPEPITQSLLAIGILIASIAIKLYMAQYNRRIGRAIDSSAMRAVSVDSISDAIATSAVLVSALLPARLNLDGWCGALVALLVIYAGIRAIGDTTSPLLGQAPDPKLIERIDSIVRSYPEVIGVHDLMVHDYGPGRLFISLHAEVDAGGDLLQLHDAIDNAEKALRDQLSCTAVIHMDPVVTDDAMTNEAKSRVAEVVKGLDERVTIHDFRMVTGPTHTNLLFDVVVPFDVPLEERVIKQRVSHMVRALDKSFDASIEVDRSAY